MDILTKTPRTCDYCYVVSDKTGNMRAMRLTAKKMIVSKPGQQHAGWPRMPADTVLISMHPEELSQGSAKGVRQDRRAAVDRHSQAAGSVGLQPARCDFRAETLEMWFADAGTNTCACDEPYTHVDLKQLISYYQSAEKP